MNLKLKKNGLWLFLLINVSYVSSVIAMVDDDSMLLGATAGMLIGASYRTDMVKKLGTPLELAGNGLFLYLRHKHKDVQGLAWGYGHMAGLLFNKSLAKMLAAGGFVGERGQKFLSDHEELTAIGTGFAAGALTYLSLNDRDSDGNLRPSYDKVGSTVETVGRTLRVASLLSNNERVSMSTRVLGNSLLTYAAHRRHEPIVVQASCAVAAAGNLLPEAAWVLHKQFNVDEKYYTFLRKYRPLVAEGLGAAVWGLGYLTWASKKR